MDRRQVQAGPSILHLVFLADVPNGHKRILDTWAINGVTLWGGHCTALG